VARSTVASTLLVALAGCAGADSGATAGSVRDSAGVMIVENSAPDSARLARWTVEGPFLEIGGLAGAEADALYGVAAARVLPFGHVVVANRGSGELRYFDGTGRHVATTGRSGQGPGEFQNLASVTTGGGDSLFAYDAGTRRVSVIAPDRSFARAFQLTAGSVFAALLGRLADGTLVGQSTEFTAVEGGEVKAGVQRPLLHFMLFDADGAVLDTIASMPGQERMIRFDANSVQIMGLPFGRQPSFAVHGDALFAATQEDNALRIIGRDGSLRRIIRTGAMPLPVTDERMDARIERLVESAPEQLRAGLRQSYRSLPRPEFLPAYAAMLVDANGNIWLADAEDPLRNSNGWTVYDPDGIAIARVTLPGSFRPLDIGRDYVLGVLRDELDVERVRLYRIRIPA
jgi:hypothetical protein